VRAAAITARAPEAGCQALPTCAHQLWRNPAPPCAVLKLRGPVCRPGLAMGWPTTEPQIGPQGWLLWLL
jgi:hypothetical protein